MNEWTDDVTDLVRHANPVPPSRAAGWRSSDEGAGVEAEVRARLTSGAAPTRTQRSRRVTLLLAAALALVVVIASTVGVIATSTSAAHTVACWDGEGPDANISVVGLGDGSPVEVCVDEWPNVTGRRLPSAFVVCTLSDGSTGVVPNDSGSDAATICGNHNASPAD
ncbi:MAG: hypothetical protein ACXWW5_03580 [Actinomycetota bacterium]